MKFYFILLSIVGIFSVSCTSYEEMLTALESKQGIDKLKKGFYTKGIKYKPIIAKLESSSDTYCWLQMSLREGKNREIRNIFESINMTVTRLIRISYGPYKLGKLQKGKLKKVNLIG